MLVPDDPEQSTTQSSWWVTLPGIITAVAGLATAIGGVILVLSQAGLIGGKKADLQVSQAQQESPVGSDAATAAETTANEPTGAIVTDPGAVDTPVPAPDTQQPAPIDGAPQGAGILRRDGDRIDVQPQTLKHNIYGESVALKNGQKIPLERVSRIDILDTPTPDGFVTVNIVLTTGKTVKGQMDSSPSFSAVNEFGPVDVTIRDIKSVSFGR
jgi:hypothetical protein